MGVEGLVVETPPLPLPCKGRGVPDGQLDIDRNNGDGMGGECLAD